jgi:uncharacterized protein
MPLTLAEVLKSTSGQMLPALCGILTKGQASAAERNIPEEVFLNDRLYPDMFPLVRQVQTATDMIARGTARLTASDFLSLPDTETSFAELIARARKVHDYVQAASNEAIEANADALLSIPLGPETRQMPGRVYLLNFVFPNVYFHTSMTYALLRHRGVVLGKRDFMTPA